MQASPFLPVLLVRLHGPLTCSSMQEAIQVLICSYMFLHLTDTSRVFVSLCGTSLEYVRVPGTRSGNSCSRRVEPTEMLFWSRWFDNVNDRRRTGP